MDKKTEIKVMELSFTILEKILLAKKYENKNEVLEYAIKSLETARSNDKMPMELKMAYLEAVTKLKGLSFEEINEIISILKDED